MFRRPYSVLQILSAVGLLRLHLNPMHCLDVAENVSEERFSEMGCKDLRKFVNLFDCYTKKRSVLLVYMNLKPTSFDFR